MRILLLAILLLMPSYAICVEYSDDEFAEFDNKKPIVLDPWEKLNRKTHKFNMFFDKKLILPAAKAYVFFTTPDSRMKVRNFLRNIGTPSDIIFSVAQTDTQSAGVLFWRFFINTTIGMLGIFDVADELGLPYINKGLGDTFGYYKMPLGNYIVLPFLGPSYGRYIFDMPANILLNTNANGHRLPLSYQFLSDNGIMHDIVKDKEFLSRLVPFTILDIRASLIPITSEFDNSSEDTYNIYRDMYTQFAKYNMEKRIRLIKEGTFPEIDKSWQENNINSAVNSFDVADIYNNDLYRNFS